MTMMVVMMMMMMMVVLMIMSHLSCGDYHPAGSHLPALRLMLISIGHTNRYGTTTLVIYYL